MSLKILIMTFLMYSVNALAADPHAADAAKGGHDAGAAGAQVTRQYVSDWQSFPTMALRDMSGAPVEWKVTKGRVTLVVFLASWCLPCQQLMDPLKKLEKKYADRYTDVLYVFAHDTEADAEGFANFHKLGRRAFLGSAKLLETFHQPELPTIYVSDRYGWMLTRYLQTKPKDLDTLDQILDLHTAL